jgi:hypothetical protein
LAAAGSSAVSLSAEGTGELAELLSSGTGNVALIAPGAAAFGNMTALGASSLALPAVGTGELAELLSSGASTVALMAPGAALLPLLHATGGASSFQPSDVPAVAAGYYWDPAQAVNSGSASFALPEAQGKTSFNQITPSLGAAPTIGTINGQAVVQHINRTAPSIDSLTRTSTQLARGWTGATMVCGWFSAASGAGLVFAHWRSNTNFEISIGNTRLDVAGHDGTSTKEAQHPMPAGWLSSGPVFLEARFVPSEPATNRLQAWVNRVRITPGSTPSMGPTLRDATSFLSFSGSVSDGSGFNISADFSHGVVCLCNGIPSEAEIDAIYNHRRLAP